MTSVTSAGGARGGSLERFAEVAFEALRPPAVAPISLSAGVSGVGGVGGFPSASLLPLSKSPTPADAGAKDSKNVEIAEVIVGAILGEFSIIILKIPCYKNLPCRGFFLFYSIGL